MLGRNFEHEVELDKRQSNFDTLECSGLHSSERSVQPIQNNLNTLMYKFTKHQLECSNVLDKPTNDTVDDNGLTSTDKSCLQSLWGKNIQLKEESKALKERIWEARVAQAVSALCLSTLKPSLVSEVSCERGSRS